MFFNQTFPYWEWIIVDDGSTDNEAIKYLDEMKNIDQRIKIYHKENEGLSKRKRLCNKICYYKLYTTT